MTNFTTELFDKLSECNLLDKLTPEWVTSLTEAERRGLYLLANTLLRKRRNDEQLRGRVIPLRPIQLRPLNKVPD